MLKITFPGLQCLRHLRELRADSNKIVKLDGILQLDGLVKLSLENNELTSVDLASSRWYVASMKSHLD